MPWWVAERNKRAVARSNKFYKIMNENKHKSCHSSSENILIEQSFNSSVTPKRTCNCRLLFCSWLLFRCTIHNNQTPQQLQRPFSDKFYKTKASRINLQREIKKTRGLTVQFGPDFLCLIAPALSLDNFSSSSSPTLLFFAYLREISMSGNG